ncbi:hypothetical protein NKR23_g11107 [Pleurostoma richardsiae]|uniref:Uncharacterized protein n=1 Tax=Pleurostoma richardsiae TaxID=41990 RepID=A0AA38RCS8_9PEZI|nr:hypothetical protein NKR23_g11107 [Pleurostoma richardsiae]
MSFPNIYTHRKVADTAAKSCEICFKLSTSVLFNPENKDYFYVCPSHLKDRSFCSPIVDQAAIEARKKKEMETEIERVKKEYEEKQRKKKEKDEKEKEKDKDKEKDKGKDKDTKDQDEKSDSPNGDAKKADDQTQPDEEPRVFALHRTFYQQRIDKKRQAEVAKRNRERLQNPNFFPSVPKGAP